MLSRRLSNSAIILFDFAAKTFKDEARVAKELYEVAGSDKKLDAKRHQH